ncbi:MAG TPA: hypothetical protein VF009_06940 [Solirubrobacterales bacterium]
MTTDAALLSLIADLYMQIQGQQQQIGKLERENAELRLRTIGQESPHPDPLGGPEEADRAARGQERQQ